jgi:hypothetical protein
MQYHSNHGNTDNTVISFDTCLDKSLSCKNAMLFLTELVYAVESDSDGDAYVAGIVGNDINSSQPGGAFVAKFDSNGNRVWTASYGSADSKDTFYALALSIDGTKLYAVGRVGSNSHIFGNESSSRNLMRPLLAVVNTTNGEITTATPNPFSPEVDEEIHAVVVDPLNGNKAVAGGMSRTSKLSSLIYGFETLDTASGRTLELKTRLSLRNGDMRPVVAVSAAAGADRFHAVEGCVLHRFKSDNRSGLFTELSSTRLEEQGTCLGSAMDVTVRANGNPVVVVLTASKYPMILQYNSSDASVTPTQKVLGTTGDVSQIRSRIISGRGAPESVFLSGSNMISNRPRAFLTGMILGNSTVNGDDIRGNQRLQRAQLIVKLATLGGTAIVLLGTLLAVFLITRHAKRSGVPA